MTKVFWTASAKTDLSQISGHIAAGNPPRSISFVNGIIAAGEAIADMPKAFPLVPRLEHRGIRKRVHGQYLIFYRIEDQDVHILHIAHGARDYIRALFSEN